MKLEVGDRVTVYWDDAWSSDRNWFRGDESDRRDMLECTSLRSHGEIFALDENSICIAHEVIEGKDIHSQKVQHLPRKFITKIEKMEATDYETE